MKKLTKFILILTMTINITACCNTNTQQNNTQQNNTPQNNNTFYLWEDIRFLSMNTGAMAGGTFVAGASFDSFPEDKKYNVTSADVVDHYGNQTYYYTKKQVNDPSQPTVRIEWRRGQVIPANTYEEAKNHPYANLTEIESTVERVQFQLNEEDEWEPVPSQHDGAPTN
jgi:hypothetical protein